MLYQGKVKVKQKTHTILLWHSPPPLRAQVLGGDCFLLEAFCNPLAQALGNSRIMAPKKEKVAKALLCPVYLF